MMKTISCRWSVSRTEDTRKCNRDERLGRIATTARVAVLYSHTVAVQYDSRGHVQCKILNDSTEPSSFHADDA